MSDAAMPGVITHDSATLTQVQQRALWDAFFDAKQALEAADWPLIRQERAPDGVIHLLCPWCDSEVGIVGDDRDGPYVHAVGVGFETTSLLSVEITEPATLSKPTEYDVQMGDTSEPETDFVGYSCDECDGTIRIEGDRTW